MSSYIKLCKVCLKNISLCIVLLFCSVCQPIASYALEPMLPRAYSSQVDVSGWLMSEKLDGVRGYWDGKHLYSKNGHLFHPPQEFVRGLPSFPLEGEIWGGRGAFTQTVSIVKRQQPHVGWLKLKFAIFDVPAIEGGFTRRIEHARRWFASHKSDYAFVIKQTVVRDAAQLQQRLTLVEQGGGEGLIVRKPDAYYVSGRSRAILKVKSFDDDEAMVVAHLPGKGRNLGRLGALLVEMKDGVRFRIGSGFSDDEREHPPAINEVVTFKYYGKYPSGIPKFPSFLRVRKDVVLN